MSTEAILRMAVESGRLVLLAPLSPRAMKRRAMYVTDDIWRMMEGDVLDEFTEERLGRLRADLETFVTEADLYPHYLYWLTPRDDLVWEIRSIADDPTLRVLGRFVMRDVFVALTIEKRSELGKWESLNWRRAKRTAIQRWRTLINFPPFGGQDQNDFFSGAIPGHYWKK